MLLVYFSLFSFGTFWYRMYTYGHHLSGDAPIKVPPFTPPIFGHQHLANFEVYSFPAAGSFILGAGVLGLCAVLAWDARKAIKK